MKQRNQRRNRSWLIAVAGIVAGLLLGIWVGSQWLSQLAGASPGRLTAAQTDEYVTLVALAYAQTENLERARTQLAALDAPNQGQLVAGVAERQIAAGSPAAEVGALAGLAVALGVRDTVLVAHLPSPTSPPAPTPAPPTPTAEPEQVQEASPTDTPAPPTATPEPPTPEPPTPTPDPPTPTPSPEPRPAVVADSPVNVRSGPGTGYPVVGGLAAGERVPVTGRNQAGDWWQITLAGVDVWVFGQVVQFEGNANDVEVAASAPPPAAPTATPRLAPQPTQPPVASAPYVMASLRLRPLGQDAQNCGGGDHFILVAVEDAAGNPLDGVRVREIYTGQVFVTGAQGKGAGRAEILIWQDGGGEVVIVDDANNPISAVSPGMPANLPSFDLLHAAGYCSCRPYPDADSCRAGWEARDFRYFPNSHYVYEILYRRSH